MELTPQVLHAAEFREARRGGYNTRDVDDFIERVAVGVGQLNERVREAEARAEAADARLAELQRELEELRRRPAPSAEVMETDETLRRTLVLAQRTADATIKEAKEEANRVLAEAREEAARTRAEAEAEARRGAESARLRAQREVEQLLADRDRLRNDLEVLTHRIDEQREQLRAGIASLQKLLDDGVLSTGPPVTLSDVARPAPEPAAAPAPPPAASAPQPPPVPASPAGDPAAGPAPTTGPAPAPAAQDEPVGADGRNGHGDADATMPFGPAAQPGAQVAALQEGPAGVDPGPPTQPIPFAVPGDDRGPWLPSELRPREDEPLGPPPAPPAAGESSPAPEPAGRPSEWGKAVFDPDKVEGEAPRFGQRR